ncbi:MAG: hypothetical protein K1X82_08450, partial [Bacteroidia bacterium]|nr:hypothetical protein [Bacteroidia bacterium]
MRILSLLAALILGINALAQKTVLVHNVYFKQGQVGLDETQKQILESIALKIQPGQCIMIFPLTTEGSTRD